MRAARFIAGDWGTSCLRLVLCDADGIALDSREGPGAAAVCGRFADTLQSLTASWQESRGSLPAILCGMVGSSIGWTQTPYVACAAKPQQILDACVGVDGHVQIVPGLSCRNRFAAPDFMRGEETQILGALQLAAELREGSRLLCLPGTHTKWVLLQDGVVSEFLTAPTGELFALLLKHSVLIRPGEAAGAIDVTAFGDALTQVKQFPDAQLLHRLFECRSRQLDGELTAPQARAYLSGLLIASDVHGALRALAAALTERSIYLVGTSELMRLYATALAAHGFQTRELAGAQASVAGLFQVYQRLSRQEAIRHA
jgi:2-dehydro-3-deoxygalactonokinase